jgi:hypothetical protein
MRFLSINRFVCAAVCLLVVSLGACVAPGSLENKDAFAKALGAGTGVPATPKGGTGGAAGGAVAGGSAAGAGGAPMVAAPGCAMGCTIITMKCAVSGCHTTVGPAGMLDLMSPNIAMRLSGLASKTTDCVGDTLLDPNTPDKSLLYTKVKMPAKCGLGMPPTGPLSADEIACMQKWVAKPTCP